MACGGVVGGGWWMVGGVVVVVPLADHVFFLYSMVLTSQMSTLTVLTCLPFTTAVLELHDERNDGTSDSVIHVRDS